MSEIIVQALANSVKLGLMTIEQVPLPYRESVELSLNTQEQ